MERNGRKELMVQTLESQFPQLPVETLEDVLEQLQWNLQRTTDHLRDMEREQEDQPEVPAPTPSQSPHLNLKIQPPNDPSAPLLPILQYPGSIPPQVLTTALLEALQSQETAQVLRKVAQAQETGNPIKVIVIMRGVPGSGKTFLSKLVLSVTKSGVSVSADDYFMDRRGNYNFDPRGLSQAHSQCQMRCSLALERAISPVVVDNTNIQAWEMIPYVRMGLQYGYKIEILEPNTTWKRDPVILTKKCQHGIPKAKIREMLLRFETVSKEQLLKLTRTNRFQGPPGLSSHGNPRKGHLNGFDPGRINGFKGGFNQEWSVVSGGRRNSKGKDNSKYPENERKNKFLDGSVPGTSSSKSPSELNGAFGMSQTSRKELRSPGMSSSLDYPEPTTAEGWRMQAYKHHQIRVEYRQKIMSAMASMPGAVSYYAQMARLHQHKMIEAHERAASLFIKSRNAENHGNVLDLHHLFVREALRALTNFLREKKSYMTSKKISGLDLVIITGRGKNSLGNVPKLGPAVLEFLKRNNLTFKDQGGRIIVKLRRSDNILYEF